MRILPDALRPCHTDNGLPPQSCSGMSIPDGRIARKRDGEGGELVVVRDRASLESSVPIPPTTPLNTSRRTAGNGSKPHHEEESVFVRTFLRRYDRLRPLGPVRGCFSSYRTLPLDVISVWNESPSSSRHFMFFGVRTMRSIAKGAGSCQRILNA